MATDTGAPLKALCDEFIAALGAEAVVWGDAVEARYRADWSGMAPVCPLALLRPVSTDQVAAALRICHAHRVPVVPQGGLTGLAGGPEPDRHPGGGALAQLRLVFAEPWALFVQNNLFAIFVFLQSFSCYFIFIESKKFALGIL